MKKLSLAVLCALAAHNAVAADAATHQDFYGTLEPFAAKSIYFVMTDRFVNGDPSNDHRDQAKGPWHTFDRPTPHAPQGSDDNIGYMGGDFKGIVDNAAYIRNMGFDAVWVTPIVDNPDAAFSGGVSGSQWSDHGKTGYHGYWGVNFYKLDEHWPSKHLDFAGFTKTMKADGLDVVLDIVCNHGSPAYTMSEKQPDFGKIHGKDGKLLADEQNLDPSRLDPQHNPLHAFYNTHGGLAQLSDLNENNPAVLDYLAGAYEQWIEQGAAAFRIDTLGWMPNAFWKSFSDRIRAKHPGFFMFGEAFDYDAAAIAPHTWARNGAISLLDFPLRGKLQQVFENKDSDFAELGKALYLEDGPYANPYELVTFYDNHDMARLNASDDGFIDANNWLFTARGIPAVYYGSETGFERGRAENEGNRDYYGQPRIDAAAQSPIYRNLVRIAQVRRGAIALQHGLQLDLKLQGDEAAFYRVYEHDGVAQTALVLLNKGDAAKRIALDPWMREDVQAGEWRDAFDNAQVHVDQDFAIEVPAHGVRVLLLDAPLTNATLRARLADSMQRKSRD